MKIYKTPLLNLIQKYFIVIETDIYSDFEEQDSMFVIARKKRKEGH